LGGGGAGGGRRECSFSSSKSVSRITPLSLGPRTVTGTPGLLSWVDLSVHGSHVLVFLALSSIILFHFSFCFLLAPCRTWTAFWSWISPTTKNKQWWLGRATQEHFSSLSAPSLSHSHSQLSGLTVPHSSATKKDYMIIHTKACKMSSGIRTGIFKKYLFRLVDWLKRQSTWLASVMPWVQTPVPPSKKQKKKRRRKKKHLFTRNTQWQKNSFFNKWCRENWTATCKRIKLEPYFIPYTKRKWEWVKDLSVRPETIKLLEENEKKAKLLSQMRWYTHVFPPNWGAEVGGSLEPKSLRPAGAP
jgi:hypothetical protein